MTRINVSGVDDSQFFQEFIEKRQGATDYTEAFIWNLDEEVPPLEQLTQF